MMTLELEAVDLKSLLASSLSIVKEKAASQRISLELDTPEDLGVPQLDMRKTKQIVYNLLSNAVKFSASGGRVILHARTVSRESVGAFSVDWPVHGFPLAESGYGEFLEISVSDGGIGISSSDMAKLFQAFSQIDSSLARRFEGTGLGLAMVKLLAELHGGTVAVASAEGQGAIFTVWLPLRTAPDNASVQAPVRGQGSPSADARERLALVVEDDDLAADLIRMLLEGEGFRVVRAKSAEAALRLVAHQTPRLITVDIQLPGMDGWEFLQQIRKDKFLTEVPALIVSGQADTRVALENGATTLLQKPLRRAQLRVALCDLGLTPDSTVDQKEA